MTFDEIYERHADAVLSYLRFKLRDIHLAEDIFQDTFLAAYRLMADGMQPDRPKAWLLTIAHRRMVDRLRRQPVSETTLEEMTPDGRSGNSLDWTDSFALMELLNRLDESSRTILYSQYVVKEEVELSLRMKSLRTSLPQRQKSMLLERIKQQAREEELEATKTAVSNVNAAESPAWLAWSEWALRLTLPPMVFPIIKLLQRRLLA